MRGKLRAERHRSGERSVLERGDHATGKIDRLGLKKMAEDHLHPYGLD
jgi:hypothetical protein